MATKEILKIDLDTSEFDAFKKAFDSYSETVKALPGEWQKSGVEITSQKSRFEAMADSIRSQAEEAANLVTSHGKAAALFDASGLALAGMAKSGRQFAGSIFQATASLRHWTKLTALFGGLIGAGGLFGIGRMAESVARQRTGAIGLGVSYGEQASFLTNFGRLGNAAGILQGFSEAETDVSKKYALRQYLGHGESGDPARDFAEGLGRFKDLVDRTPKELLGPALRQRGYDKLGFDTEFAQTVKGMSRGEIEQIGRGYGADLATRLGLAPDASKKWTEFTTRIEKAGEDIDTILWKGTSKLTKPLEHLSEGFEHLVSALFRDGSPISGWIKNLGHGISAFAEDLGSGTTHAFAEALIRDAGEAARLLAAIVTKPLPGGSAWKTAELAAIAAAAARGFGPAAIGEALAAGVPLGAAVGAAAGLAPAAALAGAGLVGSATPLNAGEDERARQERFRKGDWQGPLQEGAQGPWQGPPMPQGKPMPKGVFPKMAPAKPGSLSGKSAVEFESTNEPAPMGPGMGRYNFMHGQFGGIGQNLTTITTKEGHTVTVNKAAAPHFIGFLNDLEKAGAPIHQKFLGGYNPRHKAGSHGWSQHAYGNAVDIDSTGRNIITPDFAAWARTHDKELHAAESRWGIRAGRDMSNPDMGHWEWGGGEGSNAPTIIPPTIIPLSPPRTPAEAIKARHAAERAILMHRGQKSLLMGDHMGHHPSRLGKTAPPVEIEVEHGMVVTPH